MIFGISHLILIKEESFPEHIKSFISLHH
uniref:Uncharacterized protein n=1 Tax=Heterorhabditis bacteriophora TaxID=37862 RepID=A0A1I7X2L3_HETBA